MILLPCAFSLVDDEGDEKKDVWWLLAESDAAATGVGSSAAVLPSEMVDSKPPWIKSGVKRKDVAVEFVVVEDACELSGEKRHPPRAYGN